MVKISIITPTYNEAKNIQELATRVDKTFNGKNYELIVVDDNSPDGTGKIAEKLSKKFKVRVLHRAGKLGLSSAVIEGFNLAKGDLICVIDSDLSHPPETIKGMIHTLENRNAEIVVASRLVEGGGTEDWPATRKLTSYIATSLARLLTTIKDPMSGFFMLKREVIDGVNLVPRGYKILLEILVKGKYSVSTEHPFIFRDRTAGSSKLNFRTELEYLTQLLHLYFYQLTRFGKK